MSDCHCKEYKCDPCDKRMQGEQGLQGIQGPRGQDGLQGPQGIQGIQGIPGSCVNCFPDVPPCVCPLPEYCDLYSQLSQTLAASPATNMPGGVALFESSNVSTANLDVSQANITGEITVNRAGWYDLETGVCGTLNPISAPLLVWTMSVFKNGVLIPGSTVANMTLSPDQQANEIVADIFTHCNVGDKLKLANTSTSPLLISSPTQGSNAVPNSCYFKVMLLQAD